MLGSLPEATRVICLSPRGYHTFLCEDENTEKDKKRDTSSNLEASKGIAIVIVGGVMFSAAAAAMQDAQRIPAMEMMAVRCFIGVVLSVAAIIWRRDQVIGPKECQKWFIIRSVMCALGMVGYFLSVDWLPLGNAVSLYATNVGFALLAAKFCLNEETTMLHLCCFIMLFIGTICIAQPEAIFGTNIASSSGHPTESRFMYGLIASIAGAFFYGTQFWPLKRATENGASKLGMILMINLLGGPLAIGVSQQFKEQQFAEHPYTWAEIGAILAVAITGYYNQVSFVYAIDKIDGAMISLLYSVDVVWTYLWQILFFNETASTTALSGSALIFFAVLIFVSIKRRREQAIETLKRISKIATQLASRASSRMTSKKTSTRVPNDEECMGVSSKMTSLQSLKNEIVGTVIEGVQSVANEFTAMVVRDTVFNQFSGRSSSLGSGSKQEDQVKTESDRKTKENCVTPCGKTARALDAYQFANTRSTANPTLDL